MDNCDKVIDKIKKDLINFYDNYFLLKERNKDFYLHYQCAAQIASEIGFSIKEYSNVVRNEALYYATLYCDMGLDNDIKMGKRIDPDEKMKILKSHIRESMEILKSGSYFFKNSILIIAWHHYQPDGKGYMPEEVPKLNLYKIGGAIVSVATAFDSIFRRNFKKTSDFAYSLSIALAKLKQNAGTQFDEEVFNKFYEIIEKGIVIDVDGKKVMFKIDDYIEKTIEEILSENLFSNEVLLDKEKNKREDSDISNTFDILFNTAIRGDLYNINEIVGHLEKMISILKVSGDKFEEYFIKVVVFMSQFKYPDGEIKSFLVDAFFKFIDKYFGDGYNNVYKKILNIWIVYVKDQLPKELKDYLEIYLSNFVKLVLEFQRRFQIFDSSLFDSIKKISLERERYLNEQLKHIYDPQLIDEIKDTIERFKYFINAIQY